MSAYCSKGHNFRDESLFDLGYRELSQFSEELRIFTDGLRA
jgi:hypothetical protein